MGPRRLFSQSSSPERGEASPQSAQKRRTTDTTTAPPGPATSQIETSVNPAHSGLELYGLPPLSGDAMGSSEGPGLPRAPPPREPDWATFLRATLSRTFLGSPADGQVPQLRPLILHSGFSGMHSHSRALQELRIQAHEVAGAEPKPTAQKFARLNGLWPEHLFNDVRTIIRREVAQCATCQSECHAPQAPPDLFLAGFSCQPFSPMRGKHSTTVPPSKHPKFDGLLLMVQYMKAWQPPLALLENSVGIGRANVDFRGTLADPAATDDYDDEETAESPEETAPDPKMPLQWLRQELGAIGYSVSWARLEATPWVAMRRPRYWIFIVKDQLGGALAAEEACRLAHHIEALRRERPPASLQDLMSPTESQELKEHLWQLALHQEAVGGRGGRPPPELPSWQKQAMKEREQWRALGRPGHDAHPLSAARLVGLSRTPRHIEVLEIYLLRACFAQNLNPLLPADLARAKRDLTMDVTQNPSWTKSSPGTMASFTRGSAVYSFQEDRVLGPQELLRLMGWIGGALTGDLSLRDVRDLVGEAQALPSLATALAALLLATRSALPAVWPREP